VKVEDKSMLGYVRKLASASFRIPFHGIIIKIDNTEFGIESDNISLGKIRKAISLTDDICITRISRRDHRLYLSQDQRYVDTLFALLTNDDPVCTEQAWYIINKIPCYRDIEIKLYSFDVEVILLLRC
jgi:hypothetical protein